MLAASSYAKACLLTIIAAEQAIAPNAPSTSHYLSQCQACRMPDLRPDLQAAKLDASNENARVARTNSDASSDG